MQILVDELPESCFECPIMVDGSEGCDFCVCAILEEKATTKNRLKDCPLKTHDKEILEEQREKTFILYSLLYQELEKQDIENVASRIDYMTSENYADICELYKTAKNLKQHDRELVKEVCEKISNHFKTTCYISIDEQNIYDVLDQIQRNLDNE